MKDTKEKKHLWKFYVVTDTPLPPTPEKHNKKHLADRRPDSLRKNRLRFWGFSAEQDW